MSLEDDADVADTLDFGELLVELRDEFRSFKKDVMQELKTIKATTELATSHLRRIGLRTTALEDNVDELTNDLTRLTSVTPPPVEYRDDQTSD